MKGDRSLLRNFIEKFMGTVRFENDNFAAITGYGYYIQGNIIICHVYYVEGLGHNLLGLKNVLRSCILMLFSFGVDAVEDFKEYTLRDYYCLLKTYYCWYKLKLLDNAADSRLRLLKQSVAADDKMKK
uniref:Integrase, catalytic region, zinc finger, CCHC-type, peptidase aspartic, catalytic n=1 Tax=Tanacetum cinerariifolium TaxID=118510 RepID=A0A699TVT9_TANCI|nr:integrase, catalytic region, zinc finger, CCHC-type, peptidase aspartic, catalytic [Tanacetum cinerariifolium]